MRRSGSTLQFQLVKELIERFSRGYDVGFSHQGNFANLHEKYGSQPGFLITKCHNFIPAVVPMFAAGQARAIYVYRDLRDVFVSWMNKTEMSFDETLQSGLLANLLWSDMEWSQLPGAHVTRYEDMVYDLPSETQKLAASLGIGLSQGEATSIAEAYTLQRQQRRISEFEYERFGVSDGGHGLYNPENQLHRNHIFSGEPGQWVDVLTMRQVRRLERDAGPWLTSRGYRLSSELRGTTWASRWCRAPK